MDHGQVKVVMGNVGSQKWSALTAGRAGEPISREPYEFIDMDHAGSSPASATSPTFAPRGTRTGRDTLSKTVAVDMHSADDHIWLMNHEIGRPVQMKRFSTVSQFAGHARELAGPLPEPRGSRRSSVQARRRVTRAIDEMILANTLTAPEGEVCGSNIETGWPANEAEATQCNTAAALGAATELINVRRGRLPRSRHGSRSSSSSSTSTLSTVSHRSGSARPDQSHHLKSRSSSRSTSANSSTYIPMTQSFWLDVQTSKPDAIRDVLALFPVCPLTVEEVIDPESYDNLEAFTALNYVFMNIGCNQNLSRNADGFFSLEKRDDNDRHGEDIVVCSVICFEDWIITIHASPFAGLAECVKKIQADFGMHHHHGRVGQDRMAATGMGAQSLMTASWVLATLTDFVVQTFLPDPTVVLAEVDRVDEMVLLIAPGDRDQPDLLRRVAFLRRRISTQRALLFKKEQLLQQLLMPVMRTSFVSSQTDIAERYKHTLLQVIHIAERLDSARDILNQANMNFVSAVTMRMSRGSTRMDFRIQVLTQVATIFFPLQLIGNIFAMNVMIPLQNVENMNPFWGIVGVMGLWLVVCLIPTFLEMRHGTGTGRAMLDVDD